LGQRRELWMRVDVFQVRKVPSEIAADPISFRGDFRPSDLLCKLRDHRQDEQARALSQEAGGLSFAAVASHGRMVTAQATVSAQEIRRSGGRRGASTKTAVWS